VIVDTGRLGVDEVLMAEAAKIGDAVKPDEIFLLLMQCWVKMRLASAQSFL
jgi:signal recognition particle GTPase